MSIAELLRKRAIGRRTRLTTGWIGVDVGSAAIKIAQVERMAGRFRIARSVIVRAAEGSTFNRSAIEDGSVAREIRDAISMHGGFKGRTAACVVSMSHCELRTLISARGTEDEQRQLISLELRHDSGKPAEQREFDFWDGATTSYDDPKGMTQVHVLSIPCLLADSIGTAMIDARLQCQALDTAPLCALRALEMDSNSAPEADDSLRTIAILDWGCSAATLVIVHDGTAVLARCLRNCGVVTLVARVAERLKLSQNQAFVLLMNYGIRPDRNPGATADDLRDLIVEAALPLLHDLTDELLETFDFLKMQCADHLPRQLVMTGVGGAIPGTSEQLSGTFRMPVHPWQLPIRSADPDHPEPILANAAALSALAWEL